jgi:hypothetical protein
MPHAKGTYKRPAYQLPLALLEKSRPNAIERSLPLNKYGEQAIMLFNLASIKGFSPSSTRLLVRNRLSIALPSVVTRPESVERRPIQISLANEQVELMKEFAERSNITVHERATRAFRFTNFIAEHVRPGDEIVFLHNGEEPVIVQSSL